MRSAEKASFWVERVVGAGLLELSIFGRVVALVSSAALCWLGAGFSIPGWGAGGSGCPQRPQGRRLIESNHQNDFLGIQSDCLPSTKN